MKSFLLITGLIAGLQLAVVDLRLRQQTVFKQQANSFFRLKELEQQSEQIQLEVQEALADPQLQIAMEELGYQRNYKNTRELAERYLQPKEESSQASQNRRQKAPLW